jgi:hypothetical protein
MRELLDLWVALGEGTITTGWDTRELGRRTAARLVDEVEAGGPIAIRLRASERPCRV